MMERTKGYSHKVSIASLCVCVCVCVCARVVCNCVCVSRKRTSHQNFTPCNRGNSSPICPFPFISANDAKNALYTSLGYRRSI